MKTAPFPSFARGITDFPVDAQNYARKLDNVLLDTAGKPYVRPGQAPWFSSSSTIPSGTRIAGFYKYWLSGNSYDFIVFSQNKAYFHFHNMGTAGLSPGAAVWSEIQDTLGNSFWPSGNANTRYSSWLWAANSVFVAIDPDISLANFGNLATAPRPMVVYPNGSGGMTVRGAGLPIYGASWTLPYAATVASGNVTGTNSYIPVDGAQSSGTNFVYQFYWTYSYTDVAGTSHLVVGPLTQTVLNTSSPSANGPNILFVNLPWFTAAAADHMDPTQWTLHIARQGQSSGIYYVLQTYTYAQWNALGTKQWNDMWRDSDGFVSFKQSFYNGTFSVPGNPPRGQYGGVVNDTGYYLAGSTLYQAWPGTVDVWPPSYTLAFEEPARGFGELDYPIVFLQAKTYRVEGTIDSAGNGNMVKRVIAADKGCISAQSIVRVGRELFWAGNDGFCVTEGWTARKISGHLDSSYKRLTSDFAGALSIKGEYLPGENRIYWTMRDPSAATMDNEVVWILDLNQGLSPAGSFTTWSSAGMESGSWTSTAFIQGPGKTVLRGDKNGTVWAHAEGQVDDLVGTSAFVTRPVLPVVQTPVFTAGSPAKTKWSDKVFATMRQRGYGTNASQRHQIAKERNQNGSWLYGSVVGSTSLGSAVGVNATFQYKSHLARGSSRYNELGLQVSKAWLNLYRSDDYCTCHVTVGGVTVGADVAGGFGTIAHLADLGGVCTIAFVGDGYVAEYGIASANADVITLSAGAPVVANGTKWIVRGYPFNEDFYYENLELAVEMFDESNVLGSSYAQLNRNS